MLKNMRYCFYRYHVPDPVYFNTDIRMTIHQIGCCYTQHKEKFQNNQTFYYEARDNDEPTIMKIIMAGCLKDMVMTGQAVYISIWINPLAIFLKFKAIKSGLKTLMG